MQLGAQLHSRPLPAAGPARCVSVGTHIGMSCGKGVARGPSPAAVASFLLMMQARNVAVRAQQQRKKQKQAGGGGFGKEGSAAPARPSSEGAAPSAAPSPLPTPEAPAAEFTPRGSPAVDSPSSFTPRGSPPVDSPSPSPGAQPEVGRGRVLAVATQVSLLVGAAGLALHAAAPLISPAVADGHGSAVEALLRCECPGPAPACQRACAPACLCLVEHACAGGSTLSCTRRLKRLAPHPMPQGPPCPLSHSSAWPPARRRR